MSAFGNLSGRQAEHMEEALTSYRAAKDVMDRIQGKPKTEASRREAARALFLVGDANGHLQTLGYGDNVHRLRGEVEVLMVQLTSYLSR